MPVFQAVVTADFAHVESLLLLDLHPVGPGALGSLRSPFGIPFHWGERLDLLLHVSRRLLVLGCVD